MGMAPNWDAPIGQEGQNGSDKWTYSGGAGDPIPLNLTLHVRCRKCPACLRQRAKRWSMAAIAETKASERTWFGTLTLAPEAQYRFTCIASLEAGRSAVHWTELTEDEQFARKVAAIYREVALYLKRVRKQSGGRLRFLCVAEKHKSGDPHLHMLVHELNAFAPIRKRVLDEHWKLGHCQWRLVDQSEPKASSYLCKYLAKSSAARVRASLHYGSAPQDAQHSVSIVQSGVSQANVTSKMERDASFGSDDVFVTLPAGSDSTKTRPPSL